MPSTAAVRLGLGATALAGMLAMDPSVAEAAPRCHVAPAKPPQLPTGGGFVVTVPKLVCPPGATPQPPVVPTPRPVAGGSAGGDSGGRGGKVPFTGADVALWALAAVTGISLGALLDALGRRRELPA
jgi:hypothetical protein